MSALPVQPMPLYRFPNRAILFHCSFAITTACLVIAAGLATASAAQIKSVASADNPASPAFDVVAIHPHTPQPHEHNSIWSSPSDSHFRAENVSLLGLIHRAYDIPETRILNAPGWAGSTYFNIEASSDSSADERLARLKPPDARTEKEAMVRAMLADRFKLATHFEVRKLPVYELIVIKGQPKLGEAKLDGTTVNHGRDHLEVQGGDCLALLAQELSKEVGRPVVDKTGIAGRFDLRLRWTPDAILATGNTSADAPPSIFTALEEQLGLNLKSTHGDVQVLVVDHAQLPSEN